MSYARMSDKEKVLAQEVSDLLAEAEAIDKEGVRLSVVRHEALFVRMEVEGLRLLAVVAVG